MRGRDFLKMGVLERESECLGFGLQTKQFAARERPVDRG